jgi:hypothetical protein
VSSDEQDSNFLESDTLRRPGDIFLLAEKAADGLRFPGGREVPRCSHYTCFIAFFL